MQRVPVEQKAAMVLPYLQKAELIAAPTPADMRASVTAIVRAAGERIKVAGDILDYADFFVPTISCLFDDSAFDKRIRKPPEARALLARCGASPRLPPPPFDAARSRRCRAISSQAEGVAERHHPRAARGGDGQGVSASGCSRRWRSWVRSGAWRGSIGR